MSTYEDATDRIWHEEFQRVMNAHPFQVDPDETEIKFHQPIEKPDHIELLKNADGVYDDHHAEEQRALWEQVDALADRPTREEYLRMAADHADEMMRAALVHTPVNPSVLNVSI